MCTAASIEILLNDLQRSATGSGAQSAIAEMVCLGCRFDPLWNSLVVGGVKYDGTPFLGTVGMIGTAYTDVHVATGERHKRFR